MASDRIAAYFSHSYRPEDREVNEFFWRLLWANNFTLTVDPKSESLSVPYLECMMKRSAAFVAIVTRRSEEAPEKLTYRCSPFVIFEYGLAVQAQKPRLVFVEDGVSKYFFPESSQVVYFNRRTLSQTRGDVESKLRLLARRSDAVASTLGHPLGNVGILVGRRRDPHQELVHEVIRKFAYTPVTLDTDLTDAFRLSLLLDELDFIVLDLDSPRLPPWLLPFISGRFIPTIKLRAKTADGAPRPTVPSSGTIDLLETIAKPEELFVYYETTLELEQELAKHVKRMRGGEDRVVFASREEGLQYFRSLGRRQDKVFISNAADANPCARPLSAALRRHNVFHFHYRYQTDIELAERWEEQLPERVHASRYFLPLITKDYFQSTHCVREYELARELASAGQVSIIPYFLDSSSADIPEQGRDLSDMPISAQARTIAKDLDRMLTKAT